jgi:hypothetical protein
MRVLIAGPFRPSSEPEQTDYARALEVAMRGHGHEVDAIRIPFDPDPETLWSQLLAFRLTDVSDVAELFVATAAPCHLLRHPRKVLWMTEHYPRIEDGSAAFRSLQTADRQAGAEAMAAFAISPRLCDRVERSTGIAVQLLRSPQQEGSWASVIAVLTGAEHPVPPG